jgi:hypothetical protein
MVTFAMSSGPGRPRGPNARAEERRPAPKKVLPAVDVPAISMGELNNITGNFRRKALSDRGRRSYGKIYKAVLPSGSGEPVAVKKLDPTVSSDSLDRRLLRPAVSMASMVSSSWATTYVLPRRQPQDRPRLPVRLSHGSLHDTLHGTMSGLRSSISHCSDYHAPE